MGSNRPYGLRPTLQPTNRQAPCPRRPCHNPQEHPAAHTRAQHMKPFNKETPRTRESVRAPSQPPLVRDARSSGYAL